MQKVKMLKTLPGVLEGEIYPRTFKEGQEYEINDSLVRGFMEQGGCELVGPEHDPAKRETKVTGPAETKPAKQLEKMSKAELVAHALDAHGLELSPDNLTAKQLIEAIVEAEKAKLEATA